MLEGQAHVTESNIELSVDFHALTISFFVFLSVRLSPPPQNEASIVMLFMTSHSFHTTTLAVAFFDFLTEKLESLKLMDMSEEVERLAVCDMTYVNSCACVRKATIWSISRSNFFVAILSETAASVTFVGCAQLAALGVPSELFNTDVFAACFSARTVFCGACL